MSALKDLTGQTFGRLTVIERAGSDKHNWAQWLCACVCGNTLIVSGPYLRTGNVKSCGCLRLESCRRNGRKLAAKTSNGSGDVSDIRYSHGMTQIELAGILGIGRTAVQRAERQGRYFHAGKIQIKARVRLPGSPEQHKGKRPCHCGYCHNLIFRQLCVLRKNKSGLGFCNLEHKNLYRWHGALPKPAPAPFGSTVPVIIEKRPYTIERPKHRRESQILNREITKAVRDAQAKAAGGAAAKWTSINRTLQEAEESK